MGGRYSDTALAERFHPGLLKALELSGAGTRMTDDDQPSVVAWKNDIKRASFAIRYVYSDNGMLVRIASSFALTPQGEWKRYHYAYHCGPKKYDEGATHFRIDLDDVSGYHVHLPPNTDDHVPIAKVEPNVKDIDPLQFLKMVADYRKTGVVPVKRI